MKTEIYKLSATELSNAYENKVLSPVEVTNSIIDRIKDIDDKVNAYFLLMKKALYSKLKIPRQDGKMGLKKALLMECLQLLKICYIQRDGLHLEALKL